MSTANNPEQKLRVLVRAFGDLSSLILYLDKSERGESVDVPQFKTREARYLYDRFIAPGRGLPLTGYRVDLTRIDNDLHRSLVAKGSDPVAPEARGTNLARSVVDCFLDGTLDPCSEQYGLCMAIVAPYAEEFEKLMPNHRFR